MTRNPAQVRGIAELILLTVALVSCIPVLANSSDEITETRLLLGTNVSITVDLEITQHVTVIDNAFLEIKRLEKALSTYLPHSDISTLNREGRLVGKHPELREIISRSLHYASISDGLFDITIKPVLDLNRRSYAVQGRAPTTSELNRALALVDYHNVVLNKDSIQLVGDGIEITTDAIAKGFIVDQTVNFLLAHNIRRALVNIGGDVRVVGSDWIVALQNPRDPNGYIVTIPLSNSALATSGDYERYFDPDKGANHILNPKTGQSASALISATVVAKNATDADALATTVFVMGPHDGMELIEHIDEVEGLLITPKGEFIASTGFKWVSKGKNIEIVRNPFIHATHTKK